MSRRVYFQSPISSLLFSLTLSFGCLGSADAAALPLGKIKLPPGFSISIYADKVADARSMVWGPNGILFVGTRQNGNLYAIIDQDKNGKADEVVIIAKNLNMPNGVAYRDGTLYVAEVNRIIAFDRIESSFRNKPKPRIVTSHLPDKTWHGWKYLRFGPDGKLYVPVGAPCNVCAVKDPFASLLRLDPKTGTYDVFARGIRNTVGFDWHPVTKELWFTDNGRDMMGDDVPPDEVNVAHKAGLHFGFPRCFGTNVKDPEFAGELGCTQQEAPKAELPAHVAALGLRFYTGTQFPAEYKNKMFIAEHGSWNRTTPDGYRLVIGEVGENNKVKITPFAEGWLEGTSVWGRPVDIIVAPDGALLVSDDKADVIYRIEYKAP